MDRTRMSACSVAQAAQVKVAVAIGEEACSAVIAPLDDVQRDARKFEPWSPSHRRVPPLQE
jgi:hypothetical protein